MGTQQLLFIVLGVILVGIAIVVGMNLYDAQQVDLNRSLMIDRINQLAVMANAYYKTPAAQGGGDGSYRGWTPPKELIGRKTELGRIIIRIRAARDRVIINTRGTLTGDDGKRPVIVRGTITPDETSIKIIN